MTDKRPILTRAKDTIMRIEWYENDTDELCLECLETFKKRAKTILEEAESEMEKAQLFYAITYHERPDTEENRKRLEVCDNYQNQLRETITIINKKLGNSPTRIKMKYWYKIFEIREGKKKLEVASGEGNNKEKLEKEMYHYAFQYAQDGVVEVQHNLKRKK